MPGRTEGIAPLVGEYRAAAGRHPPAARYLAGERLDAVVVFGHGVIGAYGFLAYTSGYAPVVRAANVVLLPGADPCISYGMPAFKVKLGAHKGNLALQVLEPVQRPR